MAARQQGEAFCLSGNPGLSVGVSGSERLGSPAAPEPGAMAAAGHLVERPCGVLFADRRNDVLSQIAEGFARDLLPDNCRVSSAGVAPHLLSPWAIRVMVESGIGITGHFSKSLLSIDADDIDHLVVLEPDLDFPSAYRKASRVDWAIYTPIDTTLPERAMLGAFRLMRDVVRDRVRGFCSAIAKNNQE
ncbi:hypothetical protein [Caulobacter sp. LjRoot300]|uniref:arsenate reductase/protein-tyrosine-phosphatase family protein n=1 Tax=Caulobacter sp. LjRoot300 TaxID=3342321 RepID=UPI003ED15C39